MSLASEFPHSDLWSFSDLLQSICYTQASRLPPSVPAFVNEILPFLTDIPSGLATCSVPCKLENTTLTIGNIIYTPITTSMKTAAETVSEQLGIDFHIVLRVVFQICRALGLRDPQFAEKPADAEEPRLWVGDVSVSISDVASRVLSERRDLLAIANTLLWIETAANEPLNRPESTYFISAADLLHLSVAPDPENDLPRFSFLGKQNLAAGYLSAVAGNATHLSKLLQAIEQLAARLATEIDAPQPDNGSPEFRYNLLYLSDSLKLLCGVICTFSDCPPDAMLQWFQLMKSTEFFSSLSASASASYVSGNLSVLCATVSLLFLKLPAVLPFDGLLETLSQAADPVFPDPESPWLRHRELATVLLDTIRGPRADPTLQLGWMLVLKAQRLVEPPFEPLAAAAQLEASLEDSEIFTCFSRNLHYIAKDHVAFAHVTQALLELICSFLLFYPLSAQIADALHLLLRQLPSRRAAALLRQPVLRFRFQQAKLAFPARSRAALPVLAASGAAALAEMLQVRSYAVAMQPEQLEQHTAVHGDFGLVLRHDWTPRGAVLLPGGTPGIVLEYGPDSGAIVAWILPYNGFAVLGELLADTVKELRAAVSETGSGNGSGSGSRNGGTDTESNDTPATTASYLLQTLSRSLAEMDSGTEAAQLLKDISDLVPGGDMFSVVAEIFSIAAQAENVQLLCDCMHFLRSYMRADPAAGAPLGVFGYLARSGIFPGNGAVGIADAVFRRREMAETDFAFTESLLDLCDTLLDACVRTWFGVVRGTEAPYVLAAREQLAEQFVAQVLRLLAGFPFWRVDATGKHYRKHRAGCRMVRVLRKVLLLSGGAAAEANGSGAADTISSDTTAVGFPAASATGGSVPLLAGAAQAVLAAFAGTSFTETSCLPALVAPLDAETDTWVAAADRASSAAVWTRLWLQSCLRLCVALLHSDAAGSRLVSELFSRPHQLVALYVRHVELRGVLTELFTCLVAQPFGSTTPSLLAHLKSDADVLEAQLCGTVCSELGSFDVKAAVCRFVVGLSRGWQQGLARKLGSGSGSGAAGSQEHLVPRLMAATAGLNSYPADYQYALLAAVAASEALSSAPAESAADLAGRCLKLAAAAVPLQPQLAGPADQLAVGGAMDVAYKYMIAGKALEIVAQQARRQVGAKLRSELLTGDLLTRYGKCFLTAVAEDSSSELEAELQQFLGVPMPVVAASAVLGPRLDAKFGTFIELLDIVFALEAETEAEAEAEAESEPETETETDGALVKASAVNSDELPAPTWHKQLRTSALKLNLNRLQAFGKAELGKAWLGLVTALCGGVARESGGAPLSKSAAEQLGKAAEQFLQLGRPRADAASAVFFVYYTLAARQAGPEIPRSVLALAEFLEAAGAEAGLGGAADPAVYRPVMRIVLLLVAQARASSSSGGAAGGECLEAVRRIFEPLLAEVLPTVLKECGATVADDLLQFAAVAQSIRGLRPGAEWWQQIAASIRGCGAEAQLLEFIYAADPTEDEIVAEDSDASETSETSGGAARNVEAALRLIAELSHSETVAWLFVSRKVFPLLVTAPVFLAVQQATDPRAPGYAALQSCWVRGILPLLLQLLQHFRTRLGAEVSTIVKFYRSIIRHGLQNWCWDGKPGVLGVTHITVGTVEELVQVVALFEALRVGNETRRYEGRAAEEVESAISLFSGAASSGGTSLRDQVHVTVAYLLNRPNYLAELVKAETKEELILAQKTKAGRNALVAAVISQLALVREMLVAGR